jgi:ribosomal protein S27AE
MKHTKRCPKCQGREIWAIPHAEIPRPNATNATIRCALAARTLPNYTVVPFAPLEAWICARCGYTEWYTDPDAIRGLLANVPPPGLSGVHWVSTTAER